MTSKSTKPAKIQKSCETCKHYSLQLCEDDDGNPVERLQTIHNSEPHWTYITCAKNFGLPRVAILDGEKCHLWVAKS